jgi:Leucine-rich repeat (LRR) protein
MVDEEYIVREEAWEKYGVFLDTASDRKLVTELNLADKGIADLTPLAKLTSLTKLDLYKNQITDLTPLTGLVRLEELGLGSNQIADLTPLAGLISLRELRLYNNDIADPTPLLGLKQLEHLNLEDNPNLARAQIDKLQRPLPKCRIVHNAKL